MKIFLPPFTFLGHSFFYIFLVKQTNKNYTYIFSIQTHTWNNQSTHLLLWRQKNNISQSPERSLPNQWLEGFLFAAKGTGVICVWISICLWDLQKRQMIWLEVGPPFSSFTLWEDQMDKINFLDYFIIL